MGNIKTGLKLKLKELLKRFWTEQKTIYNKPNEVVIVIHEHFGLNANGIYVNLLQSHAYNGRKNWATWTSSGSAIVLFQKFIKNPPKIKFYYFLLVSILCQSNSAIILYVRLKVHKFQVHTETQKKTKCKLLTKNIPFSNLHCIVLCSIALYKSSESR